MEWIGILASSIILVSFVLSTEVQMRAVNLIGSLVFVAYGITIGSFTVCVFNSLMALVNAYKICRIHLAIRKGTWF